MRRVLVPFVASLIFLQPIASSASVITFTDRALFETRGDISLISNFESFDPGMLVGYFNELNPLVWEGNTYSAHHLYTSDTYMSDQILIGNPIDAVGFNITPGAPYNMLGFDMGIWIARSTIQDTASFRVTTNLGVYYFQDLQFVKAPYLTTLDFFGFIATGSDEVIQNVQVATCRGLWNTGPNPFCLAGEVIEGGVPSITNVTYGNVPEPTTITLLGLGLASLGVRRWRQRRQIQL